MKGKKSGRGDFHTKQEQPDECCHLSSEKQEGREFPSRKFMSKFLVEQILGRHAA
jgi:hypothetical protein